MSRPKSQSIAARGENTWRLTWEIGLDPTTHKRRQRRETFHGTKTAAGKRWRTVQAELDKGRHPLPDRHSPILIDYLTRWLAYLPSQNRKPTTIQNYTDLIKTRIAPVLGTKTLNQLTPLDIQHAVQQWSTSPRQDGKPGHLSPTTVRTCYNILRAALNQAVAWELIERNPATRIKPPAKNEFHPEIWDKAAVERFLPIARIDRYGIGFILALFAGLRRGEILGLRWIDIDWEHAVLSIRKQRVKVGGTDQDSTPKSQSSIRAIVVDEQVLSELHTHQLRQNQERALAREHYRDHGLVLQTVLGTPVSTRNLDRSFARAIARAQVPAIRLHDSRHTHGTTLHEAGVDLKTIADRMGHSQISITAKFYLHPNLEPQQKAAKALREQWNEQNRRDNNPDNKN